MVAGEGAQVRLGHTEVGIIVSLFWCAVLVAVVAGLVWWLT